MTHGSENGIMSSILTGYALYMKITGDKLVEYMSHW